ncbi:MAG: ATP-binding protein, partial [Candidatus Competibacteraceae bacterium]|nr:ATP-binding protein [Candidatus Competibacteraceae bacterium]
MTLTVEPLLALKAPGVRRWYLAYSGGADSHALLHLAAVHRRALPCLEVVHVDHALQPMARDWARHCERTCRQL